MQPTKKISEWLEEGRNIDKECPVLQLRGKCTLLSYIIKPCQCELQRHEVSVYVLTSKYGKHEVKSKQQACMTALRRRIWTEEQFIRETKTLLNCLLSAFEIEGPYPTVRCSNVSYGCLEWAYFTEIHLWASSTMAAAVEQSLGGMRSLQWCTAACTDESAPWTVMSNLSRSFDPLSL